MKPDVERCCDSDPLGDVILNDSDGERVAGFGLKKRDRVDSDDPEANAQAGGLDKAVLKAGNQVRALAVKREPVGAGKATACAAAKPAKRSKPKPKAELKWDDTASDSDEVMCSPSSPTLPTFADLLFVPHTTVQGSLFSTRLPRFSVVSTNRPSPRRPSSGTTHTRTFKRPSSLSARSRDLTRLLIGQRRGEERAGKRS